jgi:hypothetical protein
MAQALDDLAAIRVSVWLDDLSCPRIVTGSMACVMVRSSALPPIRQSSPQRLVQDRAMRTCCVICHCADPP